MAGSVWRETGSQAATYHRRHVPDLHHSISPTGHHQAPGHIHGHVSDVVFSFMKSGERSPVLVLYGVVAGITHSDLELEAHDGVAGAFAAAFATHGLPTLPAVVLS